MTFFLEFEDVVKRFGQSTAVNDFNLNIDEGEFVVLLGPSGCGKTTTLRMLAGFETLTAGKILLEGRPISTAKRVVPPERRDMGMMFQSFAVWPHMTVRKNISYGLKIKGASGSELTSRVDEMLRTVQLDGLGDRFPAELSGGQQQRVALARALAVNPKILLMDEPLSNLDAKLRVEMRAELHRLHQMLGFTAVYVTHDQSEAMALADRIVVMRGGHVQQIGTPSDLYFRPENAFVAGFLGQANIVPGTACEPGVVTLAKRRVQYTSVHEQAQGTKVLAIIRPAGIEVLNDTDPDSDDVLNCTVQSSVFLGHVTEIVIQVPEIDANLLTSVTPYVQATVGTKLRCRLRGVVVVHEETELTADRRMLTVDKGHDTSTLSAFYVSPAPGGEHML